MRSTATKYEIVPIGITKQGRWIAGDNALPALTALADPKLLPGERQEPGVSSEKSECRIERRVLEPELRFQY